jgi:hypothetical protein
MTSGDMSNKLKRLMGSARGLESRLTTAFEQAAQTLAGAGAGPAPLELVDLAVDEIASHVQPSGRGRYAFPFTRVTVTFVAPTPEVRAGFDAICVGPPSIGERVTRRLISRGCDNAEVEVETAFATAPRESWKRPEFHVALARMTRQKPAPAAPPDPAVRVNILVTHGTAEPGAYTFTNFPIAIGRGTDVRDSQHQLIRLNHVVFTEGGDDVNQTVSRRHARIELDGTTKRPRIIDDNSAQGTVVIRQGKGINVPRGSRGLGLQHDDEVVVGQGRLKIGIDPL